VTTDTPERELIARLREPVAWFAYKTSMGPDYQSSAPLRAADTIEALLSRVDKLEERVRVVQEVIENGYPKPGRECPHGRFYYEDCISCYDEALLGALNRSAS
jgi:hypothetical protein